MQLERPYLATQGKKNRCIGNHRKEPGRQGRPDGGRCYPENRRRRGGTDPCRGVDEAIQRQGKKSPGRLRARPDRGRGGSFLESLGKKTPLPHVLRKGTFRKSPGVPPV